MRPICLECFEGLPYTSIMLRTGCPKLGDWYQCEFPDRCGEKRCAFSFLQTFDKDKVKALKQDATEFGYAIQGIELSLYDLNNTDTKRLSFDGFSDDVGHYIPFSGWKKLTQEHPLVPYVPKNQITEKKAHLRASESGCYLAQIISKLDQEKIANMFKLELDKKLASIGILAHALRNQQHIEDYIHNETLSEIGVEPINRNLYCEKSVAYIVDAEIGEIIVKGNADALLELKDFAIGALDFKRHRHLANPKNAHKRQVLTYALGLAQSENYEGAIFGILSTRPSKKKKGAFRKEVFDVWLTKTGSKYIKEKVDSVLTKNYIEQSKILYSLKNLQELKTGKLRAWQGCHEPNKCFSSEVCDALVSHCSKEKITLADFIDNHKLLLKDYVLPEQV